jgi:hypothetical protein
MLSLNLILELLQVSVGRRVGEMAETFWSQVKPFSKLARYMTLAHWHDGFNLAFDLISGTKQRDFVSLMESKLKRNNQLLCGLTRAWMISTHLASISTWHILVLHISIAFI